MRQLTAEQLRSIASVLKALASPDALAILQHLVEKPLTITYEAIAEETGLDLKQVRMHVQQLAEVGILVKYDTPVFNHPLAGFAFLNTGHMPTVAEGVIESLFSDLIQKYSVA